LVRARHDRLGNRDQFSLLVEDAQPRRLPIARIELSRSALSRDGLPGLNLREREIEFRAMANALFDDGQHGGARQFDPPRDCGKRHRARLRAEGANDREAAREREADFARHASEELRKLAVEPGEEALLALTLESQRMWPDFAHELEAVSGISVGYRDGEAIPRDEMIAAIARIARVVTVPVSADIESGFANDTRELAETIRRVIDAEIPVAGHIGLTPQSVNVMGGYKVQGKSLAEIEQLMRDAVALDRAGVAFLVLEGIPREVANMITAEVATPTIGIGAGPDCDGQVLVFHDILNLTFTQPAKFVRRYGDAAALITDAAHAFREDVIAHQYPADNESYHLSKETRQALETVLERKRGMRR